MLLSLLLKMGLSQVSAAKMVSVLKIGFLAVLAGAVITVTVLYLGEKKENKDLISQKTALAAKVTQLGKTLSESEADRKADRKMFEYQLQVRTERENERSEVKNAVSTTKSIIKNLKAGDKTDELEKRSLECLDLAVPDLSPGMRSDSGTNSSGEERTGPSRN